MDQKLIFALLEQNPRYTLDVIKEYSITQDLLVRFLYKYDIVSITEEIGYIIINNIKLNCNKCLSLAYEYGWVNILKETIDKCSCYTFHNFYKKTPRYKIITDEDREIYHYLEKSNNNKLKHVSYDIIVDLIERGCNDFNLYDAFIDHKNCSSMFIYRMIKAPELFFSYYYHPRACKNVKLIHGAIIEESFEVFEYLYLNTNISLIDDYGEYLEYNLRLIEDLWDNSFRCNLKHNEISIKIYNILYNHLNITETHNDYEILCKERIIESMETFLDDNDLILKLR